MNTQELSVMRQALDMLKDAIRTNQHDMIMTGEECRKAESVVAKVQTLLEAARVPMNEETLAGELLPCPLCGEVPFLAPSIQERNTLQRADGWVLVPLEPTAEMLQAGQDTPVSESDEDALEDYKAVYRSMLAAAPRHHQAARVPMAGQCFDGDWGADYQHPALQRAERQPMTMDQADDLLQNRKLHGGVLIDLVRDVEKHHGIGSESQQIAEPSSQAAAKGDACGGCGETDGNKRCLGCMHPFTTKEKP